MDVDILTSGIWQTNSTILSERGSAVVVDPAYFPRELDAIVERARERGRAAAVVFTHGHWDHVMGHSALPGAPVYVSRVLADDVARGDPLEARLAAALSYRTTGQCPQPSPALREGTGIDLSAADGDVPKSVWRQNRILTR